MKFSLFKNRRKASTPEPEAKGRPLSSALPEAQDLEVRLHLDDQPPVSVELYDMNIQGAEVELPFHTAPLDGEGTVVRLDIHHPKDGWRVRANGCIRAVDKVQDATVRVGVQFTHLGELYAQLDDALGRYFNRRSAARVKPNIEDKIPVRLVYGPHRLRGHARDISRTGLSVQLPLAQAAVFKSGERISVHFELPDHKKEFEAPGVVKHGYRSGQDVVLGVEFDLLSDSPMRSRREEFISYLKKRQAEIEAWQERLGRTG